jgi:hypothetical protein
MAVALTIVVVLVVLAATAMAAVLVVVRGRQHVEPALPPADQGPGIDQLDGGWHGPNASGGFPAVPTQRTGEHDAAERTHHRDG